MYRTYIVRKPDFLPYQTQFTNFTREKIDEMVNFLREKYNARDFTIQPKLDWSRRRVRSNGGCKRRFDWRTGKMTVTGVINLQMTRYGRDPHQTYDFLEYRQLHSKPTIGTYTADGWKCQLGTIAHEVAHAFDWWLTHIVVDVANLKSVVESDASMFEHAREFKGHERRWQYLYHILREKFVNHSVRVKSAPLVATPRVEVPKTFRHVGGGSNISRICAFVMENPTVTQFTLTNWIVKEFGVTRSNASIYVKKARARTGVSIP